MKHLYSLLLCILSLLPSYAQTSYTLTDGDVEVRDGIIASCSYDFSIKDIVIPETLDGQTVTGIGTGTSGVAYFLSTAVFSQKGLTSVQLPATIRTIGANVFRRNHLVNVTFPDGMTKVGEDAFSNNDLVEIIIPKSMTTISRNAFKYNRLVSVLIETPSNIHTIETDAFYSNKISAIKLPTHSDPAFVKYIDGAGNSYLPGDDIESFDTYYRSPMPYTLTDDDVVVTDGIIESCSYDFYYLDIVIPETLDGQSVTGIADGNPGIFQSKDLYSVYLPYTLVTIGSNAFNKNNLVSIQLPDELSTVGDYAFESNNLATIQFPDGLETIGTGAFNGNKLDNLIIFPSGLNTIGKDAFSFNKITNIILPYGVTSIGNNAFYYNNLVDIELPSSLTQIGRGVFLWNTLTTVKLPVPEDKKGYKTGLWNETIPGGTQVSDFGSSYIVSYTPNNYSIIFDANGGTGTMSNQTIAYEATASLKRNTFTKTKEIFSHWNTSADNSGESYVDNADFTMVTEGATLYAQWVIGPLSIGAGNQDVISSYPNPASDYLQIDFNDHIFSKITVKNTLGTLVYSQDGISGKSYSLDLRGISSGMYFIELTDINNDVHISRFIKK